MASAASTMPDRNAAVRRVLAGLLVANLFVVAAKSFVGLSTGSLAVFGDVIHSSVDALNNVLGITVVRLASKGPDEDHPYGHAKFETVGALLIVVFLSVTIFEVLQDAVERLVSGHSPLQISRPEWGLLALTLLVNIWVVWFETREGRRWNSDILLADAAHTRADVFITIAVMAGLALSHSGYPWADPVLAILVSFLVARVGMGIVRRSLPTLVDERAFAPETIQEAAKRVPGVREVYAIRSRSAATVRFAELTIAVDGQENVSAAHRIADAVEERLRQDLDLHQIVVHIEPC
ncbi:MAG: cation diffusion facilitator family transporter [Gemmatimonadales bacterium]